MPDIPAGALLQKSKNGVSYVYFASYYYDKDATTRNKEKQKRFYIGKVVDGEFIPNDNYLEYLELSRPHARAEARLSAETVLSAAELPLYFAIAEETGLIDDLTAVWGERRARTVLSLAAFWLNGNPEGLSLYETWTKGKWLPDSTPRTSRELTEFFTDLGSEPDWETAFFDARLARLGEDDLLMVDATALASAALDNTYMQYRPQYNVGRSLGLGVWMGRKTRMPVGFRRWPAGLTGVTNDDIAWPSENTKPAVYATVLDKTMAEPTALARLLDRGSPVIVPTDLTADWVRKAARETWPELRRSAYRIRGEDCWGKTVPIPWTGPDGKTRDVWLHVYMSDMCRHVRVSDFYDRLETFQSDWSSGTFDRAFMKESALMQYFHVINEADGEGVATLSHNNEAIDRELALAGFFANITTFETSANKALLDATLTQNISRLFSAGRHGILDTGMRMITRAVDNGRLIVCFVALTILNEIEHRLKTGEARDAHTGKKRYLPSSDEEIFVDEIKNIFADLSVTVDRKGQKQWAKVSARQREVAKGLGLETLLSRDPAY